MSVFDTRQHYLRLNDTACRVMGVPEEALIGRPFPETVEDAEYSRGFHNNLRQVAETGLPVHYESFAGAPALNREHAWTTEMWPVRDDSGVVTGVALAALDSTEQHRARQRLALLNEASAAIGTTLDVVRTAEELVELLVPGYADFASVDLLEWVLGADEPQTALDGEVVLRRVAHGSGTEGTPEAAVHLGETDAYPGYSPPARALREGRAVLGQAGEPDFIRWVAERNARAPRDDPSAKASTRCSRCRCGPAAPPWASPWPSASPTRTTTVPTMPSSPRNSPAAPPSASTTPAASPANAPPPWPSSTVCCPAACPDRRRSRSPTATCPPAHW